MIYQEDLLNAVCGNPDCDHTNHNDMFWIHSGCHPTAPTWVINHDGKLVIVCCICGGMIEEIAVAARPV